MPTVSILASGSYVGDVAGELPSLKALAAQATGDSVRRISRFVQLALVGAGRCLSGRSLPAATATYFTSARGDLDVTLDALAQVCNHGRSPAPFTLINTVGNSVCFHVSRCFRLSGTSQFR